MGGGTSLTRPFGISSNLCQMELIRQLLSFGTGSTLPFGISSSLFYAIWNKFVTYFAIWNKFVTFSPPFGTSFWKKITQLPRQTCNAALYKAIAQL
jgi:hypothetical protein